MEMPDQEDHVVHLDHVERPDHPDPLGQVDRLDQMARLVIEDKGVNFILSLRMSLFVC